ncbi:uncharacterized protein AMSG_01168 [Thecamonas trahens ATCC 50062]|uniref:Uncharacterized protein n=1 Tax=Thecamonas trahens ATCC 50062 TaxID=461836 RepID=A0A0L0DMF3_THETB|nr:hypothetical protein AMSG_01168 [Thecamonas trahens ATCC 50062]KNC53455.1 hypothetical protein AMSG_01168 [Thecamonas trahens ATCC 50062]|eukprot:XP_013761779.1 hypothetical protein AMSG_01168 [Thecamonas trahens ATCC 50062]
MAAQVRGLLIKVETGGKRAKEVMAGVDVDSDGSGVFAEVTRRESLGPNTGVLIYDGVASVVEGRAAVEQAGAEAYLMPGMLGADKVVLRQTTSWNRMLPANSWLFVLAGTYCREAVEGEPLPAACVPIETSVTAAGNSQAVASVGQAASRAMVIDWVNAGSLDETMAVVVPMDRGRDDYVDSDILQLPPLFHMEVGRLFERMLARVRAGSWSGSGASVPARAFVCDEEMEAVTVERWRAENGDRIEIWRMMCGEGWALMQAGDDALASMCVGAHPDVTTRAWRFLNSDGSGELHIQEAPFGSAVEAAEGIVASAISHIYNQEH